MLNGIMHNAYRPRLVSATRAQLTVLRRMLRGEHFTTSRHHNATFSALHRKGLTQSVRMQQTHPRAAAQRLWLLTELGERILAARDAKVLA